MYSLNFNKNLLVKGRIFFLPLLFLLIPGVIFAQKYELPSIRSVKNQLVYEADSLGNQIPDYSYCGFHLSETEIPQVPVKVVVENRSTDATRDVQNAINYVAGLPLNSDGFRGAVLLKEGVYSVSGRLKISASGIVLRGSGENTILKAAGVNRETLIRVIGTKDFRTKHSTAILNSYVPVNSSKIKVENGNDFHAGESVFIRRLSPQAWIDKLDMNDFGGETGWLGWKPGQRDIVWEREITQVKGNTITLNAPLTASMEEKYGSGKITSFTWPGRISNIGIENLTLESEYEASNLKDENHCWFAVTMENCKDAWVRQVKFRHFAGSAVAIYESGSRITVEDCISTEPISEIAGQRRNTFFTMGQQTLFLRCYAENGVHDFATGFCAAGPNAFVQCESVNASGFSGALDSWATGVLFDIVSADGQALSFKNRGQDGQGAGWTAANSMFWQCSAGRIECYAPPRAQNYAYGAWSQFAGNGIWYEENSHIKPRSLFFAQLASRTGKNLSAFQNEILPFEGESTSSPTIEQAREFTAKSFESPLQLIDLIRSATQKNPISLSAENAVSILDVKIENESVKPNVTPVSIQNGWLVQGENILKGFRLDVPWWRGNPRPFAAEKARPALTRYVPGRVGKGYTDNLQQVVDQMVERNSVAIHHNYGLWYDRRRDDHERVKRFDSESWAPFYEQPFARSGQGEAWDKLSKYDLTKYNPFYWNRLKEFAELAEQKGKILIHQNYFQHNILEAGAHWTDSPWRPANNINNTGFPEPPPYAGDKRIYVAEQFYDITHPVRRELHRMYIRKCLDNFKGRSNVIQSLSAEYTGPLHFVEFWLDVISEWEQETGQNVLVALSTTKDVQDAILADEVRSKLIDIIDIRYWAYRANGTVYAPEGGKNLAPRQHARKIKPGKRSFDSVYRGVAEYRTKFADKVVIHSEGHYTDHGWAIFMAGGSLPVLPQKTNKEFLKAAVYMHPFSTGDSKLAGLQNENEGMILYASQKHSISVDLKKYNGKYEVRYLKPSSGELLTEKEDVMGGKDIELKLPASEKIVIWIKKK
jgi:hypothetical protein